MLIDAFTFFNELDMLEFRLKYLDEFVDTFVIVESTHTHSGKPKPLYYRDNRQRFHAYAHKIIHTVSHDNVADLHPVKRPTAYTPTDAHWRRENRQRNAILDGLSTFPSDALLIISDADEIPSHEALEFVMDAQPALPVACQQYMLYYNLTNLRPEDWRGSIITDLGFARDATPQWLRDKRNHLPALKHGGWHLSYFNTPENIAYKIDSFAHQEYNDPRFKDTKRLQDVIDSHADPFGRKMPPSTIVTPEFYPDVFQSCVPKHWWADANPNQVRGE